MSEKQEGFFSGVLFIILLVLVFTAVVVIVGVLQIDATTDALEYKLDALLSERGVSFEPAD